MDKKEKQLLDAAKKFYELHGERIRLQEEIKAIRENISALDNIIREKQNRVDKIQYDSDIFSGLMDAAIEYAKQEKE